jgi:hypothetical protein
LAEGQITPSGDRIAIHLVAPADLPASIQIRWPAAPTVCNPGRFTDVAAAAMKVLADAVTRHNQIKAGKLR